MLAGSYCREHSFGRLEVVRRFLKRARLTYPCVYLIKTGLPGPTPTAEEQVGYSVRPSWVGLGGVICAIALPSIHSSAAGRAATC